MHSVFERLGRALVVLAVLVFPFELSGKKIPVCSQEDFDAVGDIILREIALGEKNIRVEIAPGWYYFTEGHISLENVKAGDVSLSICGQDVLITGAGKKSTFSLDAGWIDKKSKTAAPLFDGMKRALSTAEFMDPETGLCRIAADEIPVKPGKAGNMYILISQWYLGHYYRVKEIQDGYIYFWAPGATDSRDPRQSPNADFHYAKQLPRYALLNHPDHKDVPVFKKRRIRSPRGTKIIRCDASSFFRISGGELGSVEISGIRFVGSGKGSPLLEFNYCNLQGVTVSDCVFDGIKDDVLSVKSTPSVSFIRNTVKNCHANGVVVATPAPNAVIKGNKFFNNGLDFNNYFCVVCRGVDFLIADNYFEDFTYGAIGVGIWYGAAEKVLKCSGVVENNECCLSRHFRAGEHRNLMDSGAIYTWTINDGIIIRNNYIHDIDGPWENRGIFCDDGTVNVKILSNRVERISNSYCIDLRRVLSVETYSNSRIKRVNVGNVMDGNTVDGTVRFEHRDK